MTTLKRRMILAITTLGLLSTAFLILTIALTSCGPSKEEIEQKERVQGLSTNKPTSDKYIEGTEIKYKGHTYVYFQNPRGSSYENWGGHSASCTNPIHNTQTDSY